MLIDGIEYDPEDSEVLMRNHKHTCFYTAYHALRWQLPELTLDGSSVDELDSLLWSALGHPEHFKLGYTYDLTEFDLDRLRLLAGPNGLIIFKMMLARRDHGNRCYWES